MKIKLDTLQTKRQQYKKHLQRLSNIYHQETGRKKILKQSRSVDKLMAITHRIHETSNRFRIKNMQKIQMESKSKNWGKVDCSFLPTSRKNHDIVRDQKRKHDIQQIQKQNKFLFDRLLKVKPTILPSKSSSNFNATNRNPFLPKNIKPEADFSSILNSSIIKPQKKKVITLKLHNSNHEILRIIFSKKQEKFIEDQALYFLEVSSKNGKIKESQCFYGNQLLQSQICIFKQKEEIIQKIDLKYLAYQSRVIPKGYFQIYEKQNKKQQNLNKGENVQFVFTNNKKISIKAEVLIKNIKMKSKFSQKKQETISLQAENKVLQTQSIK